MPIINALSIYWVIVSLESHQLISMFVPTIGISTPGFSTLSGLTQYITAKEYG